MSRQAERIVEAAAGVTNRRGFLGQVAKLAGGAAAAMGGLLAMPAIVAGEITGPPPCPRSRWCKVDADCPGRQVCDYGCCRRRR